MTSLEALAVGTQNPCKVAAVKECVASYQALGTCKIAAFKVPSAVSDQPMTMEEIVAGAKNRASAAVKAWREEHGEKAQLAGVGIEVSRFFSLRIPHAEHAHAKMPRLPREFWNLIQFQSVMFSGCSLLEAEWLGAYSLCCRGVSHEPRVRLV